MKQLDSEQTEQCIHLSELLLELAQQQEWQRFEALLHKRDDLLKKFVAKDYDASEADAVRLIVQRIQALDVQTRKLADASKQEALTAIRTDATKMKAANAYQKAQRRY